MIELAKPTTVSDGLPGTLVTVRVLLPRFRPPMPGPAPESCRQHHLAGAVGPVPGGQHQVVDGAAGRGAPGQRELPAGLALELELHGRLGERPGRRGDTGDVAVAASSAAVARAGFAVTRDVRAALRGERVVNGPLLAASSARPRVAEAVATSSTAHDHDRLHLVPQQPAGRGPDHAQPVLPQALIAGTARRQCRAALRRQVAPAPWPQDLAVDELDGAGRVPLRRAPGRG